MTSSITFSPLLCPSSRHVKLASPHLPIWGRESLDFTVFGMARLSLPMIFRQRSICVVVSPFVFLSLFPLPCPCPCQRNPLHPMAIQWRGFLRSEARQNAISHNYYQTTRDGTLPQG